MRRENKPNLISLPTIEGFHNRTWRHSAAGYA
jgi:hypothetical protein